MTPKLDWKSKFEKAEKYFREYQNCEPMRGSQVWNKVILAFDDVLGVMGEVLETADELESALTLQKEHDARVAEGMKEKPGMAHPKECDYECEGKPHYYRNQACDSIAKSIREQ